MRAEAMGVVLCKYSLRVPQLFLALLLAGFAGAAHAAFEEEDQGFLALSDGSITIITDENREELFGSAREKSLDTRVFHGLTWRIEYASPGVGFQAPGQGPARKAALERALSYISQVLNQPGGIVDLNVQSLNDPQTPTIATAGPTIFGFLGGAVNNGSAFAHIMNPAVDPSQNAPDMLLRVNFAIKFNLGTGDPAQDEIDLESVLIHEITHGLGFLNSIIFEDLLCNVNPPGINGRGWFNQEGPDNHSALSVGFRRGSGTRLLVDFEFSGSFAVMLGGSGGLFFAGPQATEVLGTSPQMFAPGTLQCGSSFSHWQPGSGAVMEPAILVGTARREYADFEIAALADLGYPNAGTWPGAGEGEGEGQAEGEGEGQAEGEGEGQDPGKTPEACGVASTRSGHGLGGDLLTLLLTAVALAAAGTIRARAGVKG